MGTEMLDYGLAAFAVGGIFYILNNAIGTFKEYCQSKSAADSLEGASCRIDPIDDRILAVLENNTKAMTSVVEIGNMLRIESGKQMSMLEEIIRSQQQILNNKS